MTVGRNDPCPCGSGKKYKKCCFRKDDVKRRAAERLRSVGDELDPDASIYAVWLAWRAARQRSDFNFCFDLIQPETPLAQAVGTRDAFIAACLDGSEKVPAGVTASFRHLRIEDGARAALLQTIGEDDAALQHLRVERLGFLHTPEGWRLSACDAVTIDRESAQTISLDLFE